MGIESGSMEEEIYKKAHESAVDAQDADLQWKRKRVIEVADKMEEHRAKTVSTHEDEKETGRKTNEMEDVYAKDRVLTDEDIRYSVDIPAKYGKDETRTVVGEIQKRAADQEKLRNDLLQSLTSREGGEEKLYKIIEVLDDQKFDKGLFETLSGEQKQQIHKGMVELLRIQEDEMEKVITGPERDKHQGREIAFYHQMMYLESICNKLNSFPDLKESIERARAKAHSYDEERFKKSPER